MKRLLLLAVVMLTACAEREVARPEIIEAHGATVHRDSLATELRLFLWPDYMDPQILQEFEQTYGVRVITDYYDNNEALIAKLKAGGIGQYDVIVASDYAIEVLESGTLLLSLDHAHIPNLKNLDPRFRALPFDSANLYSVTYQWGTTGLGVRMDLLRDSTAALDTWRVVFDAAAQQGPMVMLQDPRETIGAALIYLGHSPNTTDSTYLAAAEQLLVQQRPRVLQYAPFASGRDLLASGDAAVSHNYSGDILSVQKHVRPRATPRKLSSTSSWMRTSARACRTSPATRRRTRPPCRSWMRRCAAIARCIRTARCWRGCTCCAMWDPRAPCTTRSGHGCAQVADLIARSSAWY
jgi:spermidine/putrescine-binding protein